MKWKVGVVKIRKKGIICKRKMVQDGPGWSGINRDHNRIIWEHNRMDIGCSGRIIMGSFWDHNRMIRRDHNRMILGSFLSAWAYWPMIFHFPIWCRFTNQSNISQFKKLTWIFKLVFKEQRLINAFMYGNTVKMTSFYMIF